MKLQIEGQHLRIRVDEQELTQLLTGNVVTGHTQFAMAFVMHVTLRLQHAVEPVLSGRADDWQVGLPEEAVREHAARLPAREGLHYVVGGERDDDALQLLFDVDVRDSVRRRHGRNTEG